MTENKRFHWDYRTGRMKDTYSSSQATKNMRLIERQINDACRSYEKQIDKLKNENEQLKQSSTMYYNLFVELQKQMKGVKKASDLDSKDFEDLIKLSKGNVFDDEIGWIHLPVKELEE